VITVLANEEMENVRMLKNLVSFNSKYGAYLAQGPLNCNGKTLNVFINNLIKETVTIPANTLVGKLVPMSEYEETEETNENFCNMIESENLSTCKKLQIATRKY